ncbi:DNA mismatch repair protein MutS [Euzebyella marina]|uniref:DNA mismatch repair protein MutS n=1 Tax=Euzebyella marina TaxID=1761453 RepID=A0A3G2L2G1_9FLAO|nr:DNA mismatch repair protein MutS [Euzebyella marina]AYN66444.1 DNA mismatch repair protein MutS [Euzebyella marina]
MQKLESFFQNEISRHQTSLNQVKGQLFTSSMVRLALFCAAIFGVYMVYGDFKWVIAIILLTIALFLVLVNRHADLQYRKNLLLALIDINEIEIKVLKRDFHDLPEGNEFKDGLHHYSQDIDLFGRGSFYQYANRTALKEGAEVFADLLTENRTDQIVDRQKAIKELSEIPEWRQHFSATASLARMGSDSKNIAEWLKSYKGFVPSYMKFLPAVFSVMSIVIFGLYFFEIVPESVFIIWYVIGLGISGAFAKKLMPLIEGISKTKNTFDQYQKLLLIIEKKEFSSIYLQNFKRKVTEGEHSASKLIAKFSASLNSLDRNNNLVYAIIANGFFLRSLHHCYNLERWIASYGRYVENWFGAVALFDAYNSMGNFTYNHPKYVFPQINGQSSKALKSENAGHPLIDPKKMVLNDIEIEKEHFFIITGANMAGKSTFLRTISLQIVMANTGLPVCAEKMVYSPIKLITSMRTSDSLTDDESYFFSELKRLKFIVNEVQGGNYFIVLDEILKGTNSTDKAEGSRKFVQRLVGSKATGIIATHDLSLCNMAQELPEVTNYYFDAEIINDELHFDYRFKNGICQNMNASFLLKKMDIVD